MEVEEQPDENVQLFPCSLCGRKFRKEALERHMGICQKVFQSKRKVYNPTEHRLPDAADAPELAEVRKRAQKAAAKGEVGIGESKKEPPKANNAWRAKSEAFRAAMKDAQIVDKFKREGRSLSELPPPRATAPELDDRTPCPHCGRRFGGNQAERHIPKCAETKNKPKGPPAAKAAPKAGGKAAPGGGARRR